MMMDRRQCLGLMIGGVASSVVGRAMAAPGASGGAHAFTFDGLMGQPIRLADYAGKPILVVNTASFCGFRSQLSELQQIWTRYQMRGLMVIGVPSGDFGGQEAATAPEIMKEATEHFGVTFPMAAKAEVRGENAHPFYKWAAAERPAELPRWNFHKYLIGRDGQIAAVFSTMTGPTDARVIAAIARTLES
jgi:glutathione peroxidase